jgi:hypothetical protein
MSAISIQARMPYLADGDCCSHWERNDDILRQRREAGTPPPREPPFLGPKCKQKIGGPEGLPLIS